MTSAEARRVRVTYLEQPCKTALNPVRGMPFKWSLNPYMGCEHRCAFCYVRNFERRAERESGDGYGRAVRVKTNVATVLRAELGRRGWTGEAVAIGAATDPYQPAEGRYRLTRACLETLCDFSNPLACLDKHWPELLPWYLAAFGGRAHLPRSLSAPALDRVAQARSRHPIHDQRPAPPIPPPRPAQLDLPITL